MPIVTGMMWHSDSRTRDRTLLAGITLASALAVLILALTMALGSRQALERELRRALTDHASYAARLLADEMRFRASTRAMAVLHADDAPAPADSQLALLWRRARTTFPSPADTALGAFVYDCAEDHLATAGTAGRPGVRDSLMSWMRRIAAIRTPLTDADMLTLYPTPSGLYRGVAMAERRVPPDRCSFEGLVTSPVAVSHAATPDILRTVPVLPPSMLGSTWAWDGSRVPQQRSGLGVRVVNVETNTTLYDSFGDSAYAYVGEYAMGSATNATRISIGIPATLAAQMEPSLRSVGGTGVRVGLLLLLGIVLMVIGVVALQAARRDVNERQLFLSKISHELRTPLTQLRLHANTLRRERAPEDARRRAVDAIDRGAEHLSDLVENLLVLTRSQLPAWRLSPRPSDVAELLRHVVEGYAPVAARRAARIELETPGHAVLEVDPSALRQAVLNVLDNAVKYGPPGQTVRIVLETGDHGAVIRISDEGPGIPGDAFAAVAQPFYRDPATAGNVAGAGLGLAVVREIIQAHRGTVESRRGADGLAAVEIRLPCPSRGAATMPQATR